MQLKRMVACLTTGLLVSFGATAENYRWDTVAMGGGGFVSGIITSKSERGVVFARTSAYDSLNHLIGSTGNVAIGDAYSWVGAAFSNVSMLSITRDSGW